MFRSKLLRTMRALLAGVLLAGSAAAADGGFVATLSSADRDAAGLNALSPAERTTLDQLVAGDLRQARDPDFTVATDSFMSRHNEAERRQAGLDRLTPDQRKRLNELVAAALAARPKPRQRPRLHDTDILGAARPPEIHGAMTVGFGWGSGGRNFRTSSFALDYFDPTTGLAIGVGFSNVNGKGFFPAYLGDGYYDNEPFLFEDSTRGWSRGGFAQGEGQSFQCRSGPGFGGWRH